MLEKIKHTVLTVFAVLGVLFIILLLVPDDEDDAEISQNEQQVQASQEYVDEKTDALRDDDPGSSEGSVSNVEMTGDVDADSIEDEADRNVAEVNIPASELSNEEIRFYTVELDGNREVSQDIFSDYDITVVHVWGTYCAPCVSEMGGYAKLYKKLPNNVNLMGIVCDVYDGIDSNVNSAESILEDAGAEFLNIRVSDSIYNITARLQSVPTTFFVDKDGHIVGDVMEGASFDETKERLMRYLINKSE